MKRKTPDAAQPTLAPQLSMIEFADKLKTPSKDSAATMQFASTKTFFTIVLGQGKDDTLFSEYGVGDFDGKRSIVFKATPDVKAQLEELDDCVKRQFELNKDAYFPGGCSHEHNPLLKAVPDDFVFRVKIKTADEKGKATEIYSHSGPGTDPKPATLEALNPGCTAVVKATIPYLWVSEKKYGVTLVAQVVCVKPGAELLGLESLKLGDDWMW